MNIEGIYDIRAYLFDRYEDGWMENISHCSKCEEHILFDLDDIFFSTSPDSSGVIDYKECPHCGHINSYESFVINEEFILNVR